MENKDIEKLTKLAEQGDAAAIRKLADMYFYGEGVEEDNEKAIEEINKTKIYCFISVRAVYNLRNTNCSIIIK